MPTIAARRLHVGTGPSRSPQIFGNRFGSTRRPARILFRAHRLGVPDAASGGGGKAQMHRHVRSGGRCDCHVAEAIFRATVRSDHHWAAGASAVAVLEREPVAFVLGELQFSFLCNAEHCVLCQQCGAHVRRQTVRQVSWAQARAIGMGWIHMWYCSGVVCGAETSAQWTICSSRWQRSARAGTTIITFSRGTIRPASSAAMRST